MDNQLQRLSRKIFRYVIGDMAKRRAIAFAIYMKNAKPASVVKDWTWMELARITNLDRKTCKKYIACLKEMNLVREYSKNGHSYMVFEPLKARKKKRGNSYRSPKNKDVMLGSFDRTSIRAIDLHLKALDICEIQRRKNFIRQCISAKQDPKNSREYKRAERKCRACGWDRFSDDGISFEYLRRKWHCSPNIVSETISYGEKERLFEVTRYDPEIVYFGVDQAREAAEYIDRNWTWCTDDVVVYQHANTYNLCESN